MSFILDALKKSEAERRRGEVPALQDHFASPPPRRRPLWPLLLTAALILNGAVFGGWLLLRQENTPPAQTSPGELDRIIAAARTEPSKVKATEPAPSAPAETSMTASASETLQAPVLSAQPPASNPAEAPPKADTPAVPEMPAAAPEIVAFREEAADPEASAPVRKLQRAETAAHDMKAAPERAESFPLLSELPADVRSGLPRLSLQLHFFSPEPARRLVRLNGFNLREGDRGGDGLTVEEITPDGIRLSCRGVRFFLPASRR